MVYSTPSMVRLKTGLTTSEISDDDIQVLIALADAEIENTTGQKWENGTTITEYHSLYLPKRADDIMPNRILLEHYPVQSITEFILLTSDNTTYSTLDTLSSAEITAGTYQSDDYYLQPTTGLIELSTRNFDFVPNRAKITYTYGYDTLPLIVSDLSASLAGIMGWTKFMGGQYNRLDSYSIPEQTYNKGSITERITKNMESLKAHSENLFNQLGKKQRSQFYATSGGYF